MRQFIAFAAFAALVAGAQGQSFLGKNMAAWAQELDRPDEPSRRNAAYALGKLGTGAMGAVPALVKRLAEDTSAKVREAAAFALAEIGVQAAADPNLIPALSRALKDQDHLVRRSAALALGSLGITAAPAKGALDSALGDARPEVRQNVAWALGKVGPAGVPGLRKALGDADSLVKRDAAGALTGLDPKDARLALNELLPLCAENNSELRKAALVVLVNIVGAEDAAALDPIRQALGDPDAEVRINAALALSNIGGKGTVAAVPVLLDALRRGDLKLRRQAAMAFRNIGPEAKDAIPDLIKSLRDPDLEIRTNSAAALGGLSQTAEPAVPALVGLVADAKEQGAVRIEAAVALSRIGPVPPAVDAVATLLQVLQDPGHDSKVRERIVWSLRVHKAALRTLPGIYPTFSKVLNEPRNDGNRMLRYDCAYMLGVLQGPEAAPEVLNVLLEFLKDETIQIFDTKKTTVGGTGQETVQGKADTKEVGKGDGRVMALQALTQIGSKRIAERRDLVQQLQFLANQKEAFIDLREGCKKLLKTLN